MKVNTYVFAKAKRDSDIHMGLAIGVPLSSTDPSWRFQNGSSLESFFRKILFSVTEWSK